MTRRRATTAPACNTKTSTYAVDAIASRDAGVLGLVRDERVEILQRPARAHTLASESDVSGPEALPEVAIVYFHVDADPHILAYAASNAEGIVVAGAGEGEGEGAYSQAFSEAIGALDVPVVVSSRVGAGVVDRENLISDNVVAADDLPPQEAAVLLRLALAQGDANQARLEELIATY